MVEAPAYETVAISAHAPSAQAGDVVYNSAPGSGSTYDALVSSSPAMPLYSVATTATGDGGGRGSRSSGIQRGNRKGSSYLGFEGANNDTEA